MNKLPGKHYIRCPYTNDQIAKGMQQTRLTEPTVAHHIFV